MNTYIIAANYSSIAMSALASAMDQSNSPKLIAFLFTDLVDSTQLKHELGVLDYVKYVAEPHNAIVCQAFADCRGAENNYTGDGFLATFESVADAVNAALLIHDRLRRYAWVRTPPHVRIGVHLGHRMLLAAFKTPGQLIASPEADLCARVMSLGVADQTLMTRAAYDCALPFVREHPALLEASDPLELVWIAHGFYEFKGGPEPVEVFEVGTKGLAPLVAPVGSEKGRRAQTTEQKARDWRPAPGTSIPRRDGWLLERQLGEGGFGQVWLARQAQTGELRVFKFCFEPERVRHFKRELVLMNLLREKLGDRQDIAKLLEVQLERPPYFIEMEFVRDGSLEQWAQRMGGIDAVPLQTRLQLLQEIARTVAAAHAVGVIHKDLKPGNVLILDYGRQPRPLLADFGLASLSDRGVIDQLGITMTFARGELMESSPTSGTRLWQPPEVLLNQPHTVQSDIYALGVMLYQLCVGDLRKPLGNVWECDIADELLCEDIRAATHHDPARRLSSAADFACRIETLDDRHNTRRIEQKRIRRARRARALAWVTAALVAITAGTSALLFKVDNARRREENAKLAAKEGELRAKLAEARAVAAKIEAESSRRIAELRLAKLQAAKVREIELSRDLAKVELAVMEASVNHGAVADPWAKALLILDVARLDSELGDHESAIRRLKSVRPEIDALVAEPDARSAFEFAKIGLACLEVFRAFHTAALYGPHFKNLSDQEIEQHAPEYRAAASEAKLLSAKCLHVAVRGFPILQTAVFSPTGMLVRGDLSAVRDFPAVRRLIQSAIRPDDVDNERPGRDGRVVKWIARSIVGIGELESGLAQDLGPSVIPP